MSPLREETIGAVAVGLTRIGADNSPGWLKQCWFPVLNMIVSGKFGTASTWANAAAAGPASCPFWIRLLKNSAELFIAGQVHFVTGSEAVAAAPSRD